METPEKTVKAQDHTTPDSDEPVRNLNETEKLRASDLLYSMRHRVNRMEAVVNDVTGPSGENQQSFKERLIELEEFTEKLRMTTQAWLLGHPAAQTPGSEVR